MTVGRYVGAALLWTFVALIAEKASSHREVSSLVVGLIGAVVGSALTIAGDIGLRQWSDRKRFKALLRSVELEVKDLRTRARTRATHASEGVPLVWPLPTPCWDALLSSGGLERLDPTDRARLLAVYDKAHGANYLSQQAPQFVALSQLSDQLGEAGASGDALRELATTFSTKPFAELVEAIDAESGRHG